MRTVALSRWPGVLGAVKSEDHTEVYSFKFLTVDLVLPMVASFNPVERRRIMYLLHGETLLKGAVHTKFQF